MSVDSTRPARLFTRTSISASAAHVKIIGVGRALWYYALVTDDPIRDYLSKLGKLGAKATNSKLTKKQRQKPAQKAAKARWARVKKNASTQR